METKEQAEHFFLADCVKSLLIEFEKLHGKAAFSLG